MSVPKTDQKTWIKAALVAAIVALTGAVANHFISEYMGVKK